MKSLLQSLFLSAMLTMLLLGGCATKPRQYTPEHFNSRLEWLRFCAHYYLDRADICVDTRHNVE